jgi:hypothetical protein
MLTDCTEFQRITVRVHYRDIVFSFDQLPLKNQEEKPFSTEDTEELRQLIAEKMQIIR